MKLRNFFWTSEIITSFFWVVFFLILVFVNPYKANIEVLVLFFLTLFAAILGTIGALELRLVLKFKGTEKIKKKVFAAFRHGFMAASILVGFLLMKKMELFSLYDGIIFILAILLIEGYFWSKGE